MNTVKVVSFRDLQQVVATSQHSLVTDGDHNDGDGLGFNPYELLLAALGS